MRTKTASAEQDEDSMAEDLAAAYDEVTGVDDETEEVPAPQAKAEEPPAEEEAPAAELEGTPAKVEETPAKTEEPATTVSEVKAPIGMSPTAREEWAKVPKPVQEYIHKRELEIAQSMQGTKEARITHEQFTRLAQGYAPILAAEGVSSPMEAVEGLFKTVAQLRMGNAAQKAGLVASLIHTYGVDIDALGQSLVGVQPRQEDSQFESLLNQKLAPMQQMLDRYTSSENMAAEKARAAVDNEVMSFASKAEFIAELRHDMADLIDLASKRGYSMSLEEAYTKAASTHPEISAILAKRTEAERILASTKVVADKKSAASSLSGRASGTPIKGLVSAASSAEDDLRAVWDSFE